MSSTPSEAEEMLFLDLLDDDAMIQTLVTVVLVLALCCRKRKRSLTSKAYSMIERIPTQVKHLARLIGATDVDCIANLRMNRNTFGRLVLLLRNLGGLVNEKYVSVEEQVGTFLCILAHHKNNRIVGFDFWRSGQTVSKFVKVVLKAVLRLHQILYVKPEPVPDDCTDPRWKWFKGCLGALDGTYIPVKVPSADTARYRTRKGQISTNTLAVCDRKMRFVYVLPGWEGSAADGRVLRDAINRGNGFKVPKGTYYLADNGYANSEGFLTPYRSVRYHLKEWGPENCQPQNPQEIFNMRHSKARNVIERAFGVLKMRWGILRSASYYPVKTQTKLIAACFLLHNFIRGEMEVDLIEDDIPLHADPDDDPSGDAQMDYVESIESSAQWNAFRDEIANTMWQGSYSPRPGIWTMNKMQPEWKHHESIPMCKCGNGKMILKRAGQYSESPGRYYYKCPKGFRHAERFYWCDEYHASHPIPVQPEYVSQQDVIPLGSPSDCGISASHSLNLPCQAPVQNASLPRVNLDQNSIFTFMLIIVFLLGFLFGKMF